MIQDFFQLQRQPFTSVPTPEQYFPASSIEAARSSLVRLVERNEGPGLVIGSVGTGKSLLCQLLADSFRHRCRVVILPSGRLSSRRSLLQVILYELGLPYRDLDEGELRLALIDHVTNRDVCPHGVLLLVDEGENLSLALLDELRSLMNFTCDGRACIRLTLFGLPRLEEKFTHPRLESFNQRLAGRFYLEAFSVEETGEFIEQTFADCGGNPEKVFTSAALQKIHHACGGIPRLVNQLTDHALVLTALGHHEVVDAECVEEAWADLQQLPMPGRGHSHRPTQTMPADIVEFGALDELDDAVDSAETLENNEDDTESCDGGRDLEDSTAGALASTEMNEVDDETLQSEFDVSSEVTLVFHAAKNPFGDDFEEEEVVIDHFISPDALSQRHRRQVEASASARLAEQMFQLRHQPQSPKGAEVHDITGREIISIEKVGNREAIPTEVVDAPSEKSASPFVETDDANASIRSDESSRVYRNLFSQLRLRQG